MRIALMAALGCFCLAACSPQPTPPSEIGYVEPYDFGTQTAYEVAEGLEADYIPEEFRVLSLPNASGAARSLYSIVSYRDFKRGEIPPGYRGANVSELLAFMGKYGVQLNDYRNLCAPVGFFANSAQMMAATSKVTTERADGTTRSTIRYGTRLKPGKGCKWALILKEEPAPAKP